MVMHQVVAFNHMEISIDISAIITIIIVTFSFVSF